MPRKSKLIKKDESRILQEKKLLSQDEANTLEQMLDGDEVKVDSPEIRTILKESRGEKSSPSLEKVNAPQRVPTRLETNIADTSTINNNSTGEDDGSFKYISEKKAEGEKKYFKYGGPIMENAISRREIETLGKGNPFERRSVGFENSPQAKISVQENFEKYSSPKKVDKDQLGKEKLFDKKEIKYTPEKY